MKQLEVVSGDITKLEVDAIVNAANEQMLGGGGVDGAIHRAAGPRLIEACRAVPEIKPGIRCPTGEARITPGYGLKARFVVHTVGPVWQGGGFDERSLLASCYRQSLALALAHGATSIAFPAISTGVYGFPKDEASSIAAHATLSFLRDHPTFERILLVAYHPEDAARLERAVAAARI
jgi:O-acetyl-ADP-ribose deacetylase